MKRSEEIGKIERPAIGHSTVVVQYTGGLMRGANGGPRYFQFPYTSALLYMFLYTNMSAECIKS